MRRLIDEDDVIRIVEFECGEWIGLARTISRAIQRLPSERCEWTGFEDVDDDDFCSRAERRKE